MSLPFPPQLTGDDHLDIAKLQDYLFSVIDAFDNAAGQAIDPSMGQGGDGSLTIVDVPSDVIYTPSASLSVDGTLFGAIEIEYTLPDFAIGIILHYKEHSESVYKTSFADTSPEKLINLKVGAEYDIQIAGQAANGSVGPFTDVVMVTIPTSGISTGVPTDLTATGTYQSVVLTWIEPTGNAFPLEYEVQRADDVDFTVNEVSWNVDATKFVDDTGVIDGTYYYKVRSVDRAGIASGYSDSVTATTLNVPDSSIDTSHIANDAITTDKILDSNVTFAKIQDLTESTLFGRGEGSGDGVGEEITLGDGLSMTGTTLSAMGGMTIESGTYTPTLTNVANLTGSTAYQCQYMRVGSVVTVSGIFDADATLFVLTSLGISLPIASDIANAQGCAGTHGIISSTAECGTIYGDPTNNRAQADWIPAGSLSNIAHPFIFTYLIA